MLPMYLYYPWWNCWALANWHLSHALSLFLQCTSICLRAKYKWRYVRGNSFHQFGPLTTFKYFIYLISVSIPVYFVSFFVWSFWFILSHCFCFRIQVVKVVWNWVLTRNFSDIVLSHHLKALLQMQLKYVKIQVVWFTCFVFIVVRKCFQIGEGSSEYWYSAINILWDLTWILCTQSKYSSFYLAWFVLPPFQIVGRLANQNT